LSIYTSTIDFVCAFILFFTEDQVVEYKFSASSC